MADALVSHERFWYGDLPPICVKTGAPAHGTVRVTFERMPGWTLLLLFAGIFPFFIAAMFVRERVQGRVPVTDEVIERYHAAKRWLWASWGLIGAGVLLPLVLRRPAGLWALGIGVVLLVATEMWRAGTWISGRAVPGTPFVELRRVHPAFAEAVADEHARG
ncbi:MAG TPA: hypothetical protein VK906_15350 [Egicoccus sp.]|nr:hypothetical protein [Egicoccus sp.]HSK24560.1 hypothetical protein [Egicoccus sp.]